MKIVLKKIISFFSFLLSLVFNNFVCRFFHSLVVRINACNIKRRLKKCGKNFSIGRYNRFEGTKHIIIGNGFCSMDGIWLATYSTETFNSPLIDIGDNVNISRYCHIGAINRITIGDNVLIGSNVLIIDHNHGDINDCTMSRRELPLVSKGPITIGKNCWICDNVVICGNVTIGDNCVVAANSFVNKSFPNNCLVAGNPAVVVKYLQ